MPASPRPSSIALLIGLVLIAAILPGCVPLLPGQRAAPVPSPISGVPRPDGVAEVQKPYYFPEIPVTVLVGYAKGSVQDTAARLMSAQLEKILEKPVVVANRTGGDGIEAWAQLKQAKADGHVLGQLVSPRLQIAAATATGTAPYSLADYSPLANQVLDPTAMLVSQWSPFQSVERMVEAARAQPGGIRVAVPPGAEAGKLAAADLQRKMGIKVTVSEYPRVQDAVLATLNGTEDAAFARLGSLVPSVGRGQGKLLAMLGEARSPDQKDVPTLRESGIDLVSYAGMGYATPRNTSKDVSDYLAWAIYLALSSPEYVTQAREAGLTARFTGAQQYGGQLSSEMDRVKQLLPILRPPRD